MSATTLFAGARGCLVPTGPHRCFYCGAPCGGDMSAANHVKDSFTARDTVCGGNWVCLGCVAAMLEDASITLADGVQREGQMVRGYSWVITNDRALAATKAHRDFLMRTCLAPPEPPFVISISDSGQKHLLYRAVVCMDNRSPIVTLEAERIAYTPDELDERLALCKMVAAAIGKPSLSEDLSFTALARLCEYHDDETMADKWLSVAKEPTTRLAAWFTPAMKECAIEYPSRSAPVGHANAR